MSLDCNKIHFLIQDRRETSDENKFDKVQHTDLCQVKTMLQIIGLGKTGANGSQGSQGPSGADGDIGPQGIQGAPSETPGPTGEPGPQGTMGDDGPTGAMGIQGPQGNVGLEGDPTGDVGPQGSQGFKGESGADGVMGAQGFQGNGQGALSLSDLTDVDATGATGDEYLCFDGNEWTNAAIALNDLSDVNALNATGSSLVFGTIWNAANRDLYDAIADSTGNGDFTSIAAAFVAGNLTVFVRDGDYTETANVVVPDGGHLIGESIDGVQITLSGSVSVRADGNSGTVETAGTISITTGTTTVTGSGTTFTNLNPVGNNTHISIKGNCYLVSSVTNDTSLTITETFRGDDVSGVSFRALQLHKGIIMQNLTIIDGSDSGVFFRAVRGGLISNVRVNGCVDGFEIDDCCHSTIQDCVTENNSSDGFIVNNSTSISFENCLSFNNVTDGFRATNANLNLIFDSCQGSSNGNDGLKIDGTADGVNITDGIFNNNVEIGIDIGPETLSSTITSCTTLCNSFGIDCGPGVVNGCVVGNNIDHGIFCNSEAVIVGNQVFSNGKNASAFVGVGISVDSDKKVTIIGNFLFDNGNPSQITSAAIGIQSVGSNISKEHIIVGNVIVSNVRGIQSERFNASTESPGLIIISNNYIADSIFQGIHLESINTDNGEFFNVTGNIIRNNGENGIEALGNDNCTFSDNTIIGNTGHGMTITGDTCVINGNRVTTNKSNGIRIETGSTDVTYYSNNTQGNVGTDFVDNGTITTAYEAVLANELDARSATTLQLGASIATKVDIGDTGVDTEVLDNLFIDEVAELVTTTKVLTWDDTNNEVHYKEQLDLPGATGAGGYGYGEIYLDRITNDGPTGITITAKMGRVAEGDPFLTATTSNTQLFTLWNTNGSSSGTTSDHTTDSITVTKTGVYSITLRASLEATSTSGVWLFVFKDDGGTNAPLGNLSNIYETLGTNSQNVTVSGIVSLTAGDEITLRMSSLSTTLDAVIEVYSANLSVVKIS